MTRGIDHLIEDVRRDSRFPIVVREVIATRLDVEPTEEEMEAAKQRLIDRGEYYGTPSIPPS